MTVNLDELRVAVGENEKKERQRTDGDKVREGISPLINPNRILKCFFSKLNKDLSHSQSTILGLKKVLV